MKIKINMMKLEDISHPKLKNYINLVYMQGENNNQDAISKLEEDIKEYIDDKYFILSVDKNDLVKIPYGNDGEFLCPIFTDEKEYTLGMQYFSLNGMEELNEFKIEKLNEYNKILKNNPKFLGYIINISSVSYIINTNLI